MDNFGFLKVAAAIPHLRVGDCDYNAERMAALAEEAARRLQKHGPNGLAEEKRQGGHETCFCDLNKPVSYYAERKKRGEI